MRSLGGLHLHPQSSELVVSVQMSCDALRLCRRRKFFHVEERLGQNCLHNCCPVSSSARLRRREISGIPVRAASDYAVKAEQAGLTIGLQPVEDPKEQKTYFDTELTPKGFIPVFIVMQNGSAEDSFLFDKSKIAYGPADSSLSTPQMGEKAAKGALVVGTASALAISPAGLVVAMVLASKAVHGTQIQEAILKKEMQSETLSPGFRRTGFCTYRCRRTVRGRRFTCRFRSPKQAPKSQWSLICSFKERKNVEVNHLFSCHFALCGFYLGGRDQCPRPVVNPDGLEAEAASAAGADSRILRHEIWGESLRV